jgi:spermidine synthase
MYVWTSVIGIILGAMSLGYWYGGRLADKNHSLKQFAFLIFASAITIGITLIIKDLLLAFLQGAIPSLKLNSIIASLVLFAPTSFILGMVSPYAVKLKMADLSKSGRTVGNLYAISTFGSIFGTFITGFYLIPYLGTAKTTLLICIILTVLAIILSFKSLRFVQASKLIAFFVFASLLVANVFTNTGSSYFYRPFGLIADVDTEYNRVWIKHDTVKPANRPIRMMMFDPFGIQSAMFEDKDDDLVLQYAKYFRLGDHFVPDLKKGLIIGGAAYSYPKDFLDKHDTATLDVVEIDPGLTALARQYFNLKDDPRLTIYHEDGRAFLNTTKNKYDTIYIDAFNSLFVPYQLATKEAVQKMYDLLNPDGAVLVNIVSSFEGSSSDFLRAELATYKSVFPHVYIFDVKNPEDRNSVTSISLIALKSTNAPNFISTDYETQTMLNTLYKKDIPNDLPILTDDLAPVDMYIEKIVQAVAERIK